MATVNFYLDTRRAKKDGSYPIKLSIRHNGRFLVSTSFTATEQTWAHGQYTKEAQNYKAKNVAVRNLINKVETMLLSMEQSGRLRKATDEDLKKEVENLISSRERHAEHNFLYYFDEFVAKKSNPGTRSVYNTTRNKLLEFDQDCTLETINRKWLERFETWMAETMKVNAYAIHLRNIRAVFNYAIDEEYTTAYPFRKFKIKKEATRKRSLSVEQLRMLRDYPCEEYQVRYRDMFMLMFYLIGINAADLFTAKPTALENGRLEYKRAKTGKLYSVKVEPEAMEIINRYRGERYLINIMDEFKSYKNFLHRMGICLKEIGEVERKGLGGKKIRQPLFPELSSYWSRHTWATIAAELEIPVETISEALGHEYGCSTTSIYIAFDKKKVDAANRKVIDFVNGETEEPG